MKARTPLDLWHVFLVGGPVGLYYALKLEYLRRRSRHVSVLIHRENDLHREHLRALNFELMQLLQSEQSANVGAAEFWRHCTGQSEGRP